MSQEIASLLSENDIALLLDLANLACHKGFPSEARVIVDGVLAVRPNFAPALITLAYSHVVVDDFETCLDILNPLLTANPNDAEARIIQGLAFLLSHRPGMAKEAFDCIPEDSPQKQLAAELISAL